MPRTVVVTGASSGIGSALALRFAQAGAKVGLLGRDGERLDSVAAACRDAGAEVETGRIDVRARNEMASWLNSFDDRTAVDLLIANAGVMTGTTPGGEIEPADASYELVQTNVLGVLNTVQPLLPRMIGRQKGQIAIVSSLSAFIPLRDSPSYCASKSGVMMYGLSLRDLLRSHNIGVSVICPGYVTTPMSQREISEKPFEISTDRAVDAVLRGLARNDAIVAFPYLFAVWTRLGGILPDWLRERVTRASRFMVMEAESDQPLKKGAIDRPN